MNSIRKLGAAIRHMYASVTLLREAFPDRKFTPDGRMVGDIGEAIAALEHKVVLDPKSKKHWDGHRTTEYGKRNVQIKTTQGEETYLKKPPADGDLIVFRIYDNGTWRCYYNGPIASAWNAARPQSNASERFIKLSALKKLQVQE